MLRFSVSAPRVASPETSVLTPLAATLIYTACGRPFTSPWLTFAGEPEDRQHMEAFLKKVPQLVRDGSVKPLPVKLWEGGLSKISDGLAYMREGKVSAEKIVYCL